MESIRLYQFSDAEIKITIDAWFENGNLVIDGYDIGNKVQEFWNHEDYEYSLTVPPEGINFLYDHLGVSRGDQHALLVALAKRFGTNTCYSDLCKLMEDNHIPCQGFRWP